MTVCGVIRKITVYHPEVYYFHSLKCAIPSQQFADHSSFLKNLSHWVFSRDGTITLFFLFQYRISKPYLSIPYRNDIEALRSETLLHTNSLHCNRTVSNLHYFFSTDVAICFCFDLCLVSTPLVIACFLPVSVSPVPALWLVPLFKFPCMSLQSSRSVRLGLWRYWC